MNKAFFYTLYSSPNRTTDVVKRGLIYVNFLGQLEWVDSLQWNGQTLFLNSSRLPLVVNSLMEGYYRETDRLQFYWMNAAGLSVILKHRYYSYKIFI